MKLLQQEPMKPEAPRERRPYSSPELQEWGSIQDLTQGTAVLFGNNDFPKKGGSRQT